MKKNEEKTKLCKHCKMEIPAKAKVCPYCRKKQKGVAGKLIGGCICLVIIGAAIGSMSGGGKITKISGGEEMTRADDDGELMFSVGDTAEQRNIQVTLVSAVESAGGGYVKPDDGNVYLLLEFEIANNSSDDIAVSSVLGFEAYCDDYSINQDLLGLQTPEAEGKGQLDGSVAAGKKLNGVIAYEVPSDYKVFEINVSPSFWSSKSIKFVVEK